jgi:hypothetical protein
MKEFKFFTNNEPDYLEEIPIPSFLDEEPTISQYDDYDEVVLNMIRYETNPIAMVHRFEMGGESKNIIIRDITHNNNNLPLAETVTIEYELYHIELNQPARSDTRHITMSLEMYNEIRYETL